ncbi:MAG: PKD domain-containing protein [Candidatus Thermoplasmatota archaeon]
MNKKIIISSISLVIMMFLPLTTVASLDVKTTDNSSFFSDIQQPDNQIKKPLPVDMSSFTMTLAPTTQTRANQAPDFAYVKLPTLLQFSYYDYMPGGYLTHPIRYQTLNGHGQYLTFQAQNTITGNRRQYYSYIPESYSPQTGLITGLDEKQGFGTIDIHPATGDAIASWHKTDYTTAITYDDFDTTDTPGHWKNPLNIPLTPSMQYIWPIIQVGPSPQGTGYVRIYQVSNNAQQLSSGLPCEDVRIMYLDVPNTNGVDLSSMLSLSNWQTVTVFSEWRAKSCRPFQAFAIDYAHPGRVAFIGVATYLEGDLGDMPVEEGAFVWESYDYGTTWDPQHLYSDGPTDYFYRVQNPGFQGAPTELDVTAAGYHSTAVYDIDGNLHWSYMQSYGYSDSQGSYYFPYFLPQAEMIWNGASFTFREVPALQGIDPLSGHTVPWSNGVLYPTITWSTYPTSSGADIFHENTQKQAINQERNWMAHVWVDGTKSKLASDGNMSYIEYLQRPIISCSVSGDNGKTWSEPIPLTDVFNQEYPFYSQITVYPYISDKIIDLGDNWGLLSMYYFSDWSFGSKVQGSGDNLGGEIMYCAVKIKFPEPSPLTVDARGPYTGETGTPIRFGGDVFGGIAPYTYSWNFGNGQTSNEKNPQYTYTIPGNYTVTLTVTDSSNPPQTQSDTATVTVTQAECPITITVTGGIGLSLKIRNTGDQLLSDVIWDINFTGGFIFPKQKSGTIATLPAQTEETIKIFVLGFGKTTITLHAGCATKEQPATVFLIFVKI